MVESDLEVVSNLMRRAFDASGDPGCQPEGFEHSTRLPESEELSRRLSAGQLGLIAVQGSTIAGAAFVRSGNHLSLLFVEPALHKQGIGRKLLERAIDESLSRDPCITRFTVKSSPDAVEFYRRRGFVESGSMHHSNGRPVQPMEIDFLSAEKVEK